MNLAVLLALFLKTSIVLSVVAIGLKARFSDLTYLLNRPLKIGKALASMYVLMPILAFIMAEGFNLNPAVKIALVTLAVSPIPPLIPNKAFKAGGHEAYTIGLLVTTGLLAILFIPVAMKIFQVLSGVPLSISATTVASRVLTTILIPLLVGITIKVLTPAFAERIARPVGLVATLMLVVSCLPLLFVALKGLVALVGDGTLVSLSLFAIAGLVIGHLLGGPEPENRPVLALATSSRHPAIAVAIAKANFPAQKLAVAAVVLYVLISAILSIPYLSWLKRGHRNQEIVPTKHVEV